MASSTRQLTIGELEERFRGAKDVVERSHCQAIWLLAKGHSTAEVAEPAALSPRWVSQLRRRYEAEGADALGDRRRRNAGARPLLSAADLEALRERLATPPDDGGVWTGPKVAGWIATRTPDWCTCIPRAAGRRCRSSAGRCRRRARRTPGGRCPAEADSLQKKLADTLAEEVERHPGTPVEVWATDEHRLGLKPVRRRVWAPVGARPVALGHHRFEWLYVTAFVAPATGETVWYLSNGIDKPLFEIMLAAFARETGAGRDRIVLLVLDGAGWHTEPGLAIPEGIRLVYLPPYTPELQPAEHLGWPLVDEPIVNRSFRGRPGPSSTPSSPNDAGPSETTETSIAANTNFHWWPTPNAAM